MKVSQILVAFAFAIVGHANAAFQGTDEEFIKIVSEGNIPEGVLKGGDEDELSLHQRLRKLSEPAGAGERCGRNTPCKDGLDCRRIGVVRMCMPVSCMEGVVTEFIDENNLHDYPQTVMEGTGFMGRSVLNETVAIQGWGAVAQGASHIIRSDFRQSIVANMMKNPPNMTQLLINVLNRCPEAATRSGVTIMLGLHYELSGVVPKWFNNYYFAIATGDLFLDAGIDNSTGTPNFEFEFNATTGVFSDCCAGVGPDVGLELGLTAGIALSGTIADLEQCSFMFDMDAGVGSSFGLAAGVNSLDVCKFMFTSGMGLGAGIGFTGCGTVKIADIPLG